MATPSELQYHRTKVAEIASGILSGSIRPLLGARMLAGHLHQLESEVDPEIVRLIKGVDSESDALPLGHERHLWAEAALREKDQLAAAYEKRVSPDIAQAAGKLLLHYSPTAGPLSQ